MGESIQTVAPFTEKDLGPGLDRTNEHHLQTLGKDKFTQMTKCIEKSHQNN